MIAVAAHDVGDVALYPLLEEVGRALKAGLALVPSLYPLALGKLPLVAALVHDEQAQLVAQVIHDGGLRIVAHADGIGSHGLERLEAAAPYLGRHYGTQHTGIVVEAYALDFHVLAVEGKALVGTEVEGAQAGTHLGMVYHLTVGKELHLQGVEVGVVEVPAVRVL